MKITTPESTLTTTTNFPTMTSRVDPEGARRIMEMLVNLYSDRRLAIVREYTSNAVDATKAANGTEPVSITVPTAIDPNLIITDRGTGMSITEVENAFLTFAASTKRDSNEMIGGLGVGAKSAWTMAESFMVDTVKDGRRTTVRAARDLEHQVLVASEPSELPNGTTIIIPVEGQYELWERLVYEVARAHDQDMVMVNGKLIKSIAGGPSWIGPVSCQPFHTHEAGRRSLYGTDRVKIRSGGTLFAVTTDLYRDIADKTHLQNGCIVELPIGSFDHTPSRESVIATDRTHAAIKTALTQYRVAYDALKDRIETLAATDLAAAIKLRKDTLHDNARHMDLLPINYAIGMPPNSGFVNVDGKRYGRSRWEGVQDVPLTKYQFPAVNAYTVLSSTILVTGVPEKRKLSRFATFLKKEYPDVNRIITTPEGRTTLALDIYVGSGLVDQKWNISATDNLAAHFTFEEWTKKISERQTESRGPIPGYLCVINDGDGNIETAELQPKEINDRKLPVIYLERERSYGDKGLPGTVTVYLGRRKTAPLVTATNAISYTAWTMDEYKRVTATWSDDDLMAAAYVTLYHGDSAALELVASALPRINKNHPRHEVIKKVAKLLSDAAKMEAEKKISEHIKTILRSHVGEQVEKIRQLKDLIFAAYPLLKGVRSWDKQLHAHYVEYIINTPPDK